MKRYYVSVVVWIKTPPKNWWGDIKYSTGLSQYLRTAPNEKVVEAIAVKDALEEWEKKKPDSEITFKHILSWDVTDDLKS